MATERRELQWDAFEYQYYEKSSDWYWALGIIAFSLAVTSVLLGNILFAMVIILAAFALALFAGRKPKKISLKLSPTGAHKGNTLYPYGDLDSFWVEDRDNDPRIIFKAVSKTSPFIIFPVEGIPSDNLREYLGEYLAEIEHHEPLAQKIMEYLGF